MNVQTLEKKIDGDTRLEVIGIVNGLVVASCYLDNWTHDVPCVMWLYVHERQRRKGYGERLLRYALYYALEENKTHLHSYVRKDNEASLALHQKLGFKFCGEHHGIDYWMQKDLGEGL